MDINLGLSAVATGTADVITATYSPAPTLVDKKILFLRITTPNTTTTPTFSPNGLTARTITKNSGDALAVGDLDGDVILMYDLANTRWELLNAKVDLTNYVTGTDLSNWAGSSNLTTVASNLSLPGSPTTTTQVIGDSSTKIATTAFAQSLTSNMLIGFAGCAPTNLVDSSNYYIGTQPAVAATITENFRRFRFGQNQTITKVQVSVLISGVIPTNENITFALRKSATTDSNISTTVDLSGLTSNVTTVFEYTVSIDVNSATDYEFKMVTPAFSTNPTGVRLDIKFFGGNR